MPLSSPADVIHALKNATPEQHQRLVNLIWPEPDEATAADDYIASEGGGTIGFVEKYKKLKAKAAPKPKAFRKAGEDLDIEGLLNDLKGQSEDDLLREPAQKLRDYWCAVRNVDKSATSSGKFHSKPLLVAEIVRLMKDTFAESEDEDD